ncbi:hypothetical protein SOM26_15105 [Sphingomonas sp. CFBP8993]|uniref:hypothetical protein n=1 Tax=Sphingomonas sp. CFBP8993 TaxID=3096526 RepID=UPI002A6A8F72|nr:hypothetical protein [Sphingomonas sp. CFBP8993]MDY0960022.1 hypothetical protein [Sphingomonas sp. CFBP8993]
MRRTPARIAMTAALALMHERERDWAEAMAIEFDQAECDGHGLGFALGCVTVALRRLATSSAGWHVLTRYGLALVLLLPMALFHLGCAVHGLRYWLFDTDPYLAVLEAGNAGQRMMAVAYRSWSPVIMVGLVTLGTLHILIAWWITACDWRRAGRAMILAIVIVAGLMFAIAAIHPTPWGMALQGIALIAEILAVPILMAWDRRQTRSPIG